MLGAASQQQAFTLVLFTLSKHNSRVMCRFGSNLYKWGQRSNILYILMPSSSKKEKNWINFKLTVICRWISWIQWNWTLSAPLYHHVEALKETVHCILFFTMNSSEFKPRLEGPDRWCFPVKRRGSVSSELLVTQSLCLTDFLSTRPLQLLRALSNVFQPAGELWHFHFHVIDGCVALLLKQLLWIT